MTRQERSHVLDTEVALDGTLGEVTAGGGDGQNEAGDDTLPPSSIQQEDEGQRADAALQNDRSDKSLPGLLRADRCCDRVPSVEDAGEVAADIVRNRQQDEDDDSPRTIVSRQRQHQKTRHERQVGDHEEGCGDVAYVSVDSTPDSPQHREQQHGAGRDQLPDRSGEIGDRRQQHDRSIGRNPCDLDSP